MPRRLIPEIHNDEIPLSTQIKRFKEGANAPGINELPVEETRKITHWIKLENWQFLKKTSAIMSIARSEKITINMLLDQAIELLKKELGEGGE